MSISDNQPLSKLYYSIGEVAAMLNVNTSLLRFWEKEFNLTVSKKNKKGNRLFSVKEIEQIQRIYQLVKVEGYTLDGAQKALKQRTNTSHPEQNNQQQRVINQSQNFTEIIEKLEHIKGRLLQITFESEASVMEIKEDKSKIAQKMLNTTNQVNQKKRSSAKKNLTDSDAPTLFDF